MKDRNDADKRKGRFGRSAETKEKRNAHEFAYGSSNSHEPYLSGKQIYFG
jgi:hypothetical protein